MIVLQSQLCAVIVSPKPIFFFGLTTPISLGEVEDVVAQHRKCNRGPRLPDNVQLMAIGSQQTSVTSCRVSQPDTDNFDDLETPIPTSQLAPSTMDAVPTPSHPLPSAISGTMPDGNADPSQLQFYTPPVRDIIECAKQISHCDIASVNSFPLRVDFNRKASEYMNEAIAERRSQGLLILSGRCRCSLRRANT